MFTQNSALMQELTKKLKQPPRQAEQEIPQEDKLEANTASSATASGTDAIIDPQVLQEVFEMLRDHLVDLLSYKDQQPVSDATGYRKRILKTICQQELKDTTLKPATFDGLQLTMEFILAFVQQYGMLNIQVDKNQSYPFTFELPDSLKPITMNNGKRLLKLAKNTSIDDLMTNIHDGNSQMLIAILKERKEIEIAKESNNLQPKQVINTNNYSDDDTSDAINTDLSEFGFSDRAESAETLEGVFKNCVNEIEDFLKAFKKNPLYALTNFLLQSYERKIFKELLTELLPKQKLRLKKQFLFDVLDYICDQYHKASDFLNVTQVDLDRIFYNARHLNAQLESGGESAVDVEISEKNRLAVICYLLQPHNEKKLPEKFNDKSKAHHLLNLAFELNKTNLKEEKSEKISLCDWLVIKAFENALKEYESPFTENILLALRAYQYDKDLRELLPKVFGKEPTILEYLDRIIFNDYYANQQDSVLIKNSLYSSSSREGKTMIQDNRRRALSDSQKLDLSHSLNEWEKYQGIELEDKLSKKPWMALLKLHPLDQIKTLEEEKLVIQKMKLLFEQVMSVPKTPERQQQPVSQLQQRM